jgi:hypothetical protein
MRLVHFVTYRRNGGVITAVGQTDEQSVGMCANDESDVLVIDAPIDPKAFYVKDGVLAPYTEEALAVRAQQPNPWAVWIADEARWEDSRPRDVAVAQQWGIVRSLRDQKLDQSDWVTARAVERGEPVPEAWAVYRQALRDITLQADPFNIVWPEKP